jgi:site-specific recombinase XerD
MVPFQSQYTSFVCCCQYQWTKLCTSAGFVNTVAGKQHLRSTMHHLWHARGSELTHQGERIERVQRVLGQRDIRSTQGYAALYDLQMRAALEQTP